MLQELLHSQQMSLENVQLRRFRERSVEAR